MQISVITVEICIHALKSCSLSSRNKAKKHLFMCMYVDSLFFSMIACVLL